MKVIEYLEIKYKDAGIVTMSKNEWRIFSGQKNGNPQKGWKETIGQLEITRSMAQKLKESLISTAENAGSRKRAYACVALEVLENLV